MKKTSQYAQSNPFTPRQLQQAEVEKQKCPYHHHERTAGSTPRPVYQHVPRQKLTGLRPFLDIPGPLNFDYKEFRLHNHECISSLHGKYGDIVRVASQNGGRSSMVYLRDPSAVKHVLMDESNFDKTFADADDKSTEYLQYFKNLVQPLLANAEVFGSGDNSSRRKLLKKTFSASPELLPGFERAVERVMQAAWPSSPMENVDLVPLMHQLVFNLVMVIMAGEDVDMEKSDALFNVCSECLAHFQERYSQPLFDENISEKDEFWMRKVELAGQEVTRAFKEKFDRGNVDSLADTVLLGVMQKFELSNTEISGTMINALFAACEAPVHILVTMLVELSKRPGVQEQLYREICEMEKTEDGRDDLYFGSSFLNDCVMEALRAFAPVTLVQRRAIRDTALLGFDIPKNTVIGVCIASVHGNEQFFPEPKKYDPYRKDLDMVILNPENGFMPFSSGPRGCPGRYLAATILKLGVSRIVSKYRLHASPNAKGGAKIYKFVEFPLNGAFVGLLPRAAPQSNLLCKL
jgi:cytochrome P450